jgi:transcriptional regulator with XRE-family HTH domain
MTLGTNIKTIRTSKQIKQKDLASSLGITHNYLSMIENGAKTPSLSLISRVANALEVPLKLLFSDLTLA